MEDFATKENIMRASFFTNLDTLELAVEASGFVCKRIVLPIVPFGIIYNLKARGKDVCKISIPLYRSFNINAY